MPPPLSPLLATASRDSYLALRRVERQQAMIERLFAAPGLAVPLAELAHEQGVSARTIARDIDRLRLSGVPLVTTPGRGGGVRLAVTPEHAHLTVTLDLPEIAALLSSLTNLGPTATPSASSAMRKLTAALGADPETF